MDEQELIFWGITNDDLIKIREGLDESYNEFMQELNPSY